MAEREPNLISSGLCRTVTIDGVTVQVEIYRLENETGWTLEVIDKDGASTVWSYSFDTDDAADAAFLADVQNEGIAAVIGKSKVIPFYR